MIGFTRPNSGDWVHAIEFRQLLQAIEFEVADFRRSARGWPSSADRVRVTEFTRPISGHRIQAIVFSGWIQVVEFRSLRLPTSGARIQAGVTIVSQWCIMIPQWPTMVPRSVSTLRSTTGSTCGFTIGPTKKHNVFRRWFFDGSPVWFHGLLWC